MNEITLIEEEENTINHSKQLNSKMLTENLDMQKSVVRHQRTILLLAAGIELPWTANPIQISGDAMT
jgi:hypothetical protein